MSLRDLYQEIILDHGKTPRNYGRVNNADCCQCGHNPLCGDQLTLSLKFNADDLVDDVKFEGNGCAISVASASLMTESIKGKTRKEMEQLFSQFHQLVTTGVTEDESAIGKLAVFAGVAAYPIRIKCATLAWHTLKAALAKESKQVSTE